MKKSKNFPKPIIVKSKNPKQRLNPSYNSRSTSKSKKSKHTTSSVASAMENYNSSHK
jgi:hypothetical protein